MKEARHIKTFQYYACKVINKKMMEGKEDRVREEITILKKVSEGHPNIVTLHDYFESARNVYLVVDLCPGGDLFDRTVAKGNYGEQEAAYLIRIIMKAVEYIHDSGIVHRNMKAEKLMFRTKAKDAEVVITDFGLSKMIDNSTAQRSEAAGTLGYMAPETLTKSEHLDIHKTRACS